MGITITKLKMWKNPGYTKGCVEAPPAGSWKLPNPDYSSIENLRPRKGSTISAVELPLSFCEVFDMSYLYMEASDSANNTIKVFGWIDSIEQTASSDEAVLIRWSVDYWRTYSGSVTFGAGQITKCSDSTYKRPYRTQPRNWKTSKSDMISISEPNSQFFMVYVVAVFTVNGVSTIKYFEFPTYDHRGVTFYWTGDTQTTYGTLSLDACYQGYVDELIAAYCSSLNPSPSYEIIGCYASRLKSSFWTEASQWSYAGLNASDIKTGNVPDIGTVAMIENQGPNGYYYSSISPSIMTDDMTQYVIVDYQGNVQAYLPYGIGIKGVYVSTEIGVNGGYERVILTSDNFDVTYNEMITQRALKSIGLEFTIPCITIPITDNQWSAYLLGGQRDYDITSARIANDQKGVSGLTSTFQAGIGGGIAGASAGPLGAVGGLIGGALGQGIMTGIEYGLGKNFNDQLQDAKDRLYSNQQNGILLSGGSRDWYNKNNYQNKAPGAYIIKLSADTVSAAEYTADITINGYDVNIPVGSAASFITAGGPLRITQLMITGSVPPQAKAAIKSLLETGLRIVENNPSGVVP